MKKKLLVITAVLAVAAALLAVVFSFSDIPSDYLGTRLYQGNRIVVNMHITVDGRAAQACKNEEDNQSFFSLSQKPDCIVLSARANNYDVYDYYILINDEIPLHITARHFNWWEITRSDLYIDINTAANTYTISEHYRYTHESELGYSIKAVDEPQEELPLGKSIDTSIGPKG